MQGVAEGVAVAVGVTVTFPRPRFSTPLVAVAGTRTPSVSVTVSTRTDTGLVPGAFFAWNVTVANLAVPRCPAASAPVTRTVPAA